MEVTFKFLKLFVIDIKANQDASEKICFITK